MDLTNELEIKALKEAFSYSFKGPLGEKTLEFLEEFCGLWKGGPATEEELRSNVLQYERGRRDVILTLRTIANPDTTPEQIAAIYRREQ